MHRPCRHPRCPNDALPGTTRCADHTSDAKPRTRDYGNRVSARARGYDAAWEAYARAYLADHPSCQCCIELGVTPLPSKYVHHRDGNPRNNDPSNHEAVCATCHQGRHRTLKHA